LQSSSRRFAKLRRNIPYNFLLRDRWTTCVFVHLTAGQVNSHAHDRKYVGSHVAVTVVVTSQWIARFGVPDVIITDKGWKFETKLMRELTMFNIQHTRTFLYHSQPNGMVERLHHTLKGAITTHESSNWSRRLPTVFLAVWNTVNITSQHRRRPWSIGLHFTARHSGYWMNCFILLHLHRPCRYL